MNSSRFFLTLTTLAFVVALAVPAVNAGSMGNGAVQRQRLVVDSIDVAGGSIVFKSMADNSIHPYKINASTRVTVVNVKGSIDQIEVGQKVVNFRADGGQPPQTLTILILNQPPSKAAPPTNK